MNPKALPSRAGMHDLILPQAISLWPATPAWFVLGAIVLSFATWLAWRLWRQWQSGAYRREALRALDAASTPAEMAAILKRTALAAWPRAQVAALSGADWAAFLRRTAPEARLPDAAARGLAILAYADAGPPGTQAAARLWIRRHDRPRA